MLDVYDVMFRVCESNVRYVDSSRNYSLEVVMQYTSVQEHVSVEVCIKYWTDL